MKIVMLKGNKNDKDDSKLDFWDPGTSLFFWMTKAIAGLSCLSHLLQMFRYFFCLIVEQLNTKMLNMSSDTLLDRSRSDI